MCDAGLDITETPQGFQISMRIHSAYFKFLIGQKGQMKKRLEMETRTQVNWKELIRDRQNCLITNYDWCKDRGAVVFDGLCATETTKLL